MANKFKKGDIIKGTESGNRPYSVTNERMTRGEVVEVHNYDSVRVKVLEHITQSDEIGKEYDVEYKYFEYITSRVGELTPLKGYNNIQAVEENSKTYLVINDKYVVCINDSIENIGLSSCNLDDKFNLESGKALAYYRQQNGGLLKEGK
jgi:hypothetical protein